MNLARTPSEKTDLRRALLAWRAALAHDARQQAEAAMAEHLVALLTARGAHRIAGYWPIRGEPSLDPAWRRLMQAGAMLALPVVRAPGAPLVFKQWDGSRPTDIDHARVPAPIDAPQVEALDAVVVPCVGVDARGFRLGYGGGYYDRTLAAWPVRPWCIGVAFEGQCVEFVADAHDVPLDAIVTERGARLVCAARAK